MSALVGAVGGTWAGVLSGHLPTIPPPVAVPSSGLCLPTVVCPSQIIDIGGGLTSSLAKQAATSVLDSVGSGLTQAAAWLVAHVMALIQESTRPEMGAHWFSWEMGLMERVALTVLLPLLMAATIGPVLRQDGRRLWRVWAVGLPMALFAGLAASQLAGLGLAATDSMCSMVEGPHAEELGRQFARAMIAGPVAAAPLLVQMILAGLAVAGALAVWLELTVRSAGVYVATFFMPLTLAAYVWPVTAGLAKRAVEILVSLILSKFVIVASLSLGLAALTGGGVDAPVSGAAILLIAAFAPFALLRLAPVVEASAIAHLEGMSRRPARAAARVASYAAAAPTHPATQLVMSAATARAGSGAASAGGGLGVQVVTAQHLPEAQAAFPLPGPVRPAEGDAGGGGQVG